MSGGGGYIHTARRILPALFRMMGKIDPTFEIPDVSAIDDDFLRAHGIRGLIWDVDGTLTAHHAPEVDPAIDARFAALRDRPDLRHAIVSNCPMDRFHQLGDLFPDLPLVLGFETPDGDAFWVLEDHRLTAHGVGRDRLVAGSDGIRPLRKPSAALVHAAMRVMGLEDTPEAVLMVGDQHFTDIAAANLAGVRSAKVATLHRSSFPPVLRVAQRFEAVLYRLRGVVRGSSAKGA
jgi:predicted HAD superfamily phosphohydrolase YqeG